MKLKVVLILIGLGCVLSAGCRSSDLTRSQAKRILDNVAAQQSFNEVTISAAELKKVLFIKDGAPFFDMVQRGGVNRCLPDSTDARLMMGEFVLCRNPITADAIAPDQPAVLLRLKVPVKWYIVEVTGIAAAPGGPNDRVVEDTWQFDLASFPEEIRSSLKTAPLKGKALLRLYDDGWRFVQFM